MVTEVGIGWGSAYLILYRLIVIDLDTDKAELGSCRKGSPIGSWSTCYQ